MNSSLNNVIIKSFNTGKNVANYERNLEKNIINNAILENINNANSVNSSNLLNNNSNKLINKNFQNVVNSSNKNAAPSYPKNSFYNNYQFAPIGNKRSYNAKGLINSRNPLNSNSSLILDNNDPDLIDFYFYDLVNGILIPFRATFTALSMGGGSQWNPIRYVGRADRIFIYDGMERNISFTFQVYSASPDELSKVWKNTNYLMSLLSPSKYTKSPNSGVGAGFIVPPFVKLTIGDFIKNQPICLKNINITVDNKDYAWQLGPPGGGSFTYPYGVSNGSGQGQNPSAKVVSSGDIVAQVPYGVEITVSAEFLEKDQVQAGVLQFGDDGTTWGNTISGNNVAQGYNTYPINPGGSNNFSSLNAAPDSNVVPPNNLA